MFTVKIFFQQQHLVLRAEPSELYVLAEHVTELRKLKETSAFAAYFRNTALVNRPARKLFDAWLRKDRELWTRIYRAVHDDKDAP